MPTLKVLDLCCSEGGISEGIRQACEEKGVGLTITGVDIAPQPRYPFYFIQTEAVQFLQMILQTETFDFVHVSPPCKSHTVLKHLSSHESILSEITLDIAFLLRASNIPYTIENTPRAPIRPDATLQGPMFSLPTIRKRIFEVGNWPYLGPTAPNKHGSQRTGEYLTVAGKGGYRKDWRPNHISALNRPPNWTTGSPTEDKKIALGITWMSDEGLSQAIPPAYSKHLFSSFLDWYLASNPPKPTPLTPADMSKIKLQKILLWAERHETFTKHQLNIEFDHLFLHNSKKHLGELIQYAIKKKQITWLGKGLYTLSDNQRKKPKPATKPKPTTPENQLSLF